MLQASNAVGQMTSYGVPMTCPAIVDEETQRAALATLSKGRVWSGPNAVKYEALLRKVARCGACGRTMHIAPRKHGAGLYYVCAAHREPGHASECGKFHRVATTDAALRDALREALSDPDRILRGLQRPTKAAAGRVEEVEDICADLADLAKREEKLVRLASKGKMSDEVYERQAVEIARLREAAESRLSVAQAQVEAAQRASAKRQDIEAALAAVHADIARDDFAGWRRVVERLSSEYASVRIMPDGEVKLDGRLPVPPAGGEPVAQVSGHTTSTSS
jgi:hypothetical protein